MALNPGLLADRLTSASASSIHGETQWSNLAVGKIDKDQAFEPKFGNANINVDHEEV